MAATIAAEPLRRMPPTRANEPSTYNVRPPGETASCPTETASCFFAGAIRGSHATAFPVVASSAASARTLRPPIFVKSPAT